MNKWRTYYMQSTWRAMEVLQYSETHAEACAPFYAKKAAIPNVEKISKFKNFDHFKFLSQKGKLRNT